MPQSHLERLLALATVAGAITFVLLAGMNLASFRPSTFSAPQAQGTTTAPVRASSPPRTVTRSERATRPVAPVRPAPSVTVSVAENGRSWLEVRAGDAQGDQLFAGMLASGEERVFRKLPVWIRVGASESVTVDVDGDEVEPRANGSGVTEFVVSARGAVVPVG